MFLIFAIKPTVEKKFKTKKKNFLFVLGLLAATKALFKRNEKNILVIDPDGPGLNISPVQVYCNI